MIEALSAGERDEIPHTQVSRGGDRAVCEARAEEAHVVCSRYSLELALSMLFLGTSSLNSGPKYSMYSLNGRSAPISTPAARPVSNAHVRATFRIV